LQEACLLLYNKIYVNTLNRPGSVEKQEAAAIRLLSLPFRLGHDDLQ